MWNQMRRRIPHWQLKLMRWTNRQRHHWHVVLVNPKAQENEISEIIINLQPREDSVWIVFLMILSEKHTLSQTGTSLGSCHQQVEKKACVPVDGADAGHTFLVAHLLQQKSISDLPGEHGRVVVFQLQDRLDNFRRGHFGFWATDYTWCDAPGLVVPESTILSKMRERESS